jgi:hypothetical protein
VIRALALAAALALCAAVAGCAALDAGRCLVHSQACN